jgi:hypothetical protein
LTPVLPELYLQAALLCYLLWVIWWVLGLEKSQVNTHTQFQTVICLLPWFWYCCEQIQLKEANPLNQIACD